MASSGDGAGEAKISTDSLLGEEDVVLDQDHDFEDITYRQALPTFASPEATQFSSEHFSVHDLEDSVMRSANGGSSSGYQMRGACVAGHLQQPSFGLGQPFAMPGMGQKPDAKALGLRADSFAPLSSQGMSSPTLCFYCENDRFLSSVREREWRHSSASAFVYPILPWIAGAGNFY